MKLYHRADDLMVKHEINVTPFIDVMLVLLIIFMVAAPLATVDVPVDLPVSAAEAQPQTEEPVIVSLSSSLAVSIGNDTIDRAALEQRLVDRTKGDRQARIFLRADKIVPYGDVMALMDLLRKAGFLKVALVGLDQGDPAS